MNNIFLNPFELYYFINFFYEKKTEKKFLILEHISAIEHPT